MAWIWSTSQVCWRCPALLRQLESSSRHLLLLPLFCSFLRLSRTSLDRFLRKENLLRRSQLTRGVPRGKTSLPKVLAMTSANETYSAKAAVMSPAIPPKCLPYAHPKSPAASRKNVADSSRNVAKMHLLALNVHIHR